VPTASWWGQLAVRAVPSCDKITMPIRTAYGISLFEKSVNRFLESHHNLWQGFHLFHLLLFVGQYIKYMQISKAYCADTMHDRIEHIWYHFDHQYREVWHGIVLLNIFDHFLTLKLYSTQIGGDFKINSGSETQGDGQNSDVHFFFCHKSHSLCVRGGCIWGFTLTCA